MLAATLDRATGTFLENDRSPGRKIGTIDNRGSHFYLALYWAQELAAQTEDADLAAAFKPLAEKLAAEEKTIVEELIAVQGKPADIGGYYFPDPEKTAAVMRPSATLNGGDRLVLTPCLVGRVAREERAGVSRPPLTQSAPSSSRSCTPAEMLRRSGGSTKPNRSMSPSPSEAIWRMTLARLVRRISGR